MFQNTNFTLYVMLRVTWVMAYVSYKLSRLYVRLLRYAVRCPNTVLQAANSVLQCPIIISRAMTTRGDVTAALRLVLRFCFNKLDDWDENTAGFDFNIVREILNSNLLRITYRLLNTPEIENTIMVQQIDHSTILSVLDQTSNVLYQQVMNNAFIPLQNYVNAKKAHSSHDDFRAIYDEVQQSLREYILNE